MIIKLNQKGDLFYKKWKKEVWRFIFLSPLVIIFVGFLFILGAKDGVHLAVSVILLIVYLIIFIIGLLRLMNSINKTIQEIIYNTDTVEILTHRILWLSPKNFILNKADLEFIQNDFKIDKKVTKMGWKVKLKGYDKELNLYKCFFSQELEEIINHDNN